MGKEKRKTRLDKTGSVNTSGTGRTEFIGFSAFASSPAIIPPPLPAAAEQGGVPNNNRNVAMAIISGWSPVYTGKDERLQQLFLRISQKRDATTKVKAVQDFQEYIFGTDDNNSEGLGSPGIITATSSNTVPSKRAQVEGLQHFAWLYFHKLFYDVHSAVRAEALIVWRFASQRFPKAVAALVTQTEPQILGMWYAAQTDVAAEVRAAGLDICQSSCIESDMTMLDSSSWPWREGLFTLVRRILSFGRASVMHEALFARKSSSSTNNKEPPESSSYSTFTAALTELQRDALEERFERLTANCLDAMTMWLQEHEVGVAGGDTTAVASADNHSEEPTAAAAIDAQSDVKIWCKTLSSPKVSLRRKTYRLLATACSRQPQLLKADLSNLVKTLAQVISSEKDAGNISALLELTLAVLVINNSTNQPTPPYVSSAKNSNGTATEIFLQKPLTKLLKKACFGSPVALWGPTLLPLIAIVPAHAVVVLLQAAWEGRVIMLAQADQWHLATAVAECTAFVLLRKQQQQPERASSPTPPLVSDEESATAGTTSSMEDTRTLACLWSESFYFFVNQEDVVSNSAPKRHIRSEPRPAEQARSLLVRQLARNLWQFQEEDRPNCFFAQAQTWFWTDHLQLGQSQPSALAEVLQTIIDEQQMASNSSDSAVCKAVSKGDKHSGFLVPLLSQRFHEILRSFTGDSGSIPNEAAFKAFEATLRYCNPILVFDRYHGTGTSLEKFVMNDLLRWTLLHTSELSQHKGSIQLVEQEFRILLLCLIALEDGEKQRSLWESFLREIVAAKCDLVLLGAGIRTLAHNDVSNKWLPCASLDRLAMELGQTPVDSSDPKEEEIEDCSRYEHHRDMLILLMGLESNRSTCWLIGKGIMSSWMATVQASSRKLLQQRVLQWPIVEALLSLLTHDNNALNHTDKTEVLLAAWRQGGSRVQGLFHDLLKSAAQVDFVASASAQLKEQLGQILEKESSWDRKYSSATIWASRAWNLLQIPPSSTSKQVLKGTELSIIGLGDVKIWTSYPRELFLCAVLVLGKVGKPADRLSLITGSDKSCSALLSEILMSFSEASTSVASAARTRMRSDLASKFLEVLGGSSMDATSKASLISAVIFKLSDESSDDKVACRGIALLSQLMDQSYPRILPPDTLALKPEDVVEGLDLWYISDPSAPATAKRAHVVKAHFDAQAGYYFTIRINLEGETQERQTVAERLRRNRLGDPNLQGVYWESLSESERSRRVILRESLLAKVIKPGLRPPDASRRSLWELVHLVAFHIGLGGEHELGTGVELSKFVGSLEHAFTDALAAKKPRTAARRLRSLSVALGYGLNMPSGNWNMCQMGVDPMRLIEQISSYYETNAVGADRSLDRAVIMSISVCLHCNPLAGAARKLLVHSVGLGCRIVTSILRGVARNDIVGEDFFVCSRAMYDISTFSMKHLTDLDDAEAGTLSQSKVDAFSHLIMLFGVGPSNVEPRLELAAATGIIESSLEWISFSSLSMLLQLCPDDLISACTLHGNAALLFSCLLEPLKRQHAFSLIYRMASRKSRLQIPNDAGEVTLHESTVSHLTQWSDGLEAEEADELVEDAYIVAEWIPLEMMDYIESWGEEGVVEIDETTTMGRFLTWLAVLRWVEVAAPQDFRNRPAFLSYLSACDAVRSMMNLALLHDEYVNESKRKASATVMTMNDLLRHPDSGDDIDNRALLSSVASLIIFRTIEILPSLSRRWWENDCPKVYTAAVQMFVEKQVAPQILQDELLRIKSATGSSLSATFGAMNVNASAVSREVTATYIQDDFTLTVLIRLPPAFPFRSAHVDCSKTLGVPQQRWKRWSLQITLMLNNQGGTLQDALLLWKENVDKEFEGVEPCPVCYSVLHVKTHKLPAMECKTCRNRFHFDCLTQWFRSSGKNQCVLCQQPWQGTRVQ